MVGNNRSELETKKYLKFFGISNALGNIYLWLERLIAVGKVAMMLETKWAVQINDQPKPLSPTSIDSYQVKLNFSNIKLIQVNLSNVIFYVNLILSNINLSNLNISNSMRALLRQPKTKF